MISRHLYTMPTIIYRIIGILLCLTLSNTLVAKGWGDRASPVTVDHVKQQLIAPTNWVTAEVISAHDIHVPVEISEKIIWLPEIGSQITKGATLVKLDNTDIKLKIEQASSRLSASQARRAFAQKEAARSQRLEKSGHVSVTRLETSLQNREVADAEYDAAKAELALLERQLAKTIIQAPFDGLVMERMLKPFEWAKQGEPVLRFIATQMPELRAFTPLKNLPALHIGDTIEYRLNKTIFSGIIKNIIAAGSNASHQAELRIKADKNNSSPLIIGSILQLAIPTELPKLALTVPRDALILRKGEAKVYKIAEDNTATAVMVNLGVSNHSRIEVKGNLLLGDIIVIRGGERLRPGQKVKILNAPPQRAQKQNASNNKAGKKAWD